MNTTHSFLWCRFENADPFPMNANAFVAIYFYLDDYSMSFDDIVMDNVHLLGNGPLQLISALYGLFDRLVIVLMVESQF